MIWRIGLFLTIALMATAIWTLIASADPIETDND
jgi:hypothetical protein